MKQRLLHLVREHGAEVITDGCEDDFVRKHGRPSDLIIIIIIIITVVNPLVTLAIIKKPSKLNL